ncbi:MraY family glycosyltransferase [Clostridium cylindrosporum]|uniref:Putative undecaprenyl-phosphate N-acetylglucosaminyl 1-phosphate transferase TagO n=1 Tax=Clostridium cylindrosporum DSM 605 TaxID=1121307 RepID=A0A0J8DAA9_CLOCY|nr:MraY family glycosyltransferase [Clostridium cylindrosporum]KMT22787.1 putative undecaprenyl-phosphate N-acetylglucosaminyl 1-phosphate transferase TagO [Clostridium cylindrosporum DSM 605]
MNFIMLLLAAMIISFSATPLVKGLAIRVNAIDVPKDDRRVHKVPIPRLGGLAIYISFSLCSLAILGMQKNVLGVLLGGSLIVAMGIYDDIKPLKAIYKLIVQIIAALILISFNIKVHMITVPFDSAGNAVDVTFLAIPITILWVVGITNAFNLIDGLDGLACGICFISCLTLFGVAFYGDRYTAIVLTLILAGACLGFLPYNSNPAKIFLGDTGSQFLGFILAAISIEGAIKSTTALVVAVPILALGLPIYDTLFAMIRRKINNRPMMEADKGHLHHRLLEMGLTQKQAVYTMYILSSILGVSSIIAMIVSSKQSFALLVVVCALIIAFAVEMEIFKNKNKSKE